MAAHPTRRDETRCMYCGALLRRGRHGFEPALYFGAPKLLPRDFRDLHADGHLLWATCGTCAERFPVQADGAGRDLGQLPAFVARVDLSRTQLTRQVRCEYCGWLLALGTACFEASCDRPGRPLLWDVDARARHAAAGLVWAVCGPCDAVLPLDAAGRPSGALPPVASFPARV